MICISSAQKTETLAYFRQIMPEFNAITNETFLITVGRVALYIPEFVQTHLHRKYCDKNHNWEILKEILVNWVAHVLVLTDALAVAEGATPQPAELFRTASSLSEAGLSVGYDSAKPSGDTPEAIFDYLTRTAYGENAKMLIEQCLTGARGVFIV